MADQEHQEFREEVFVEAQQNPQPEVLNVGVDAIAAAMAHAFTAALGNFQPVANQQRDDKLPVPTFDGEGDVELFIRQFSQVAIVARWEPAMILLKLRNAVRGKAQPCAAGLTVDDIYAKLRLRFGMSADEARGKLALYKRTPGVSLAELASDLQHLVSIGFGAIPQVNQEQLVADAFRRSTGNDGLHRHLLAIPGHNVEELVRAGNAYLRTFGSRNDRACASELVEEIRAVESATNQNSEISELKQLVVSLQKQVAQLTRANTRPQITPRSNGTANSGKKPVKCYGCGQLGHIRSNCNMSKKQGN